MLSSLPDVESRSASTKTLGFHVTFNYVDILAQEVYRLIMKRLPLFIDLTDSPSPCRIRCECSQSVLDAADDLVKASQSVLDDCASTTIDTESAPCTPTEPECCSSESSSPTLPDDPPVSLTSGHAFVGIEPFSSPLSNDPYVSQTVCIELLGIEPFTPPLPNDPYVSQTSEHASVGIEPFTPTLPNEPEEDYLLQMLLRPPLPSPPCLSDDSSDSQLTDDEHASHCSADVPQQTTTIADHLIEEHWSDSDLFWEGVDGKLDKLKEQHWFDRRVLDLLDLSDWQCCVNSILSYITEKVDSGSCRIFKVGITEHPSSRWEGYCREGTWITMSVVYVAPISKWFIGEFEPPPLEKLKRVSTGTMERELIKHVRDLPECQNTAPGGEGASDGSPHFCYIVFG